MKITKTKLAGILYALNWNGHIELPDGDINWIADEMSKALTGQHRGTCENCGSLATVMVFARIGNICEECVGDMGRMAEETRKAYER